MQKLHFLALPALLCSLFSYAQISVTGNSATITTPVNAPAIVVDNTLSVISGTSFDGAKVSVSSNFNTGDVLAYTGTLPTGVSAAYNATTGVLSFTGTATPADYEALFRTVTYQTSSTNTTQRTVLFNLSTMAAYSGNGHLYEFVPGSYSWMAARTAAAGRTLYGMQGYLATVTSTLENSFVITLSGKGWLGGSDDYTYINAATGTTTYANQGASEGKWFWVTGPEKGTQFSNGSTVITYANWSTGEPNNGSSLEHYVENFYKPGGEWNDSQNGDTRAYVVEYGGMAGDPAVDVIHSRDITLVATALRTTAPGNAYDLQAPAVFVDNSLLLYSSANITNAKATISSGFNTGDVLSYTAGSLPGGVSGSYSASTGVLSFTGTATPAAWQVLLRTVKFNSTSTTIGSRSVSFSVGNLISGNNGHFYEYVSTTGDWGTAKNGAAARTYLGLQGYLATITSQVENDFIQQKLSADAWIGMVDAWDRVATATGISYTNQSQTEGKFHWVTGPEAGTQITTANTPNATSLPPVFGGAFNNWNIGEPNNNAGTEHFGQIYSTGGNPGKWNDRNGGSSLPYVVEYGGLATDPLLELSASKTIVITRVLPVNGLVFNASKKNETTVLTWSTEAEEKTIRFDVMHSVDGSTFTKIGEVAATGSSTGTSNYSFTHSAVNAGTNYYRLNIIDRDGKTTGSSVKQVVIKGKPTIHPNPSTDQFILNNPFNGGAIMIVKNAGGALVIKKSINQMQTIVDVRTLPAGVYFVEVMQGNNVSETIKLIKK